MHSFYGTRLSDNMAKTPEGYLICYDVNIARIGTQEYLGSELGVDEEVVVVNRPPEEVFKPATIASFEGKPFTNDHPYQLLDVDNTSIYEKGHVQNVRISDDKTYIIADIMVKDAQTIRDIENGKRELSAGYNCDCMKDEAGNWYQCNIIGNHVALVDKGRAGNKVRINDNEWNEQDHPRDKDGKFTSGGGGGGSANNTEKMPKSGSSSSNKFSKEELSEIETQVNKTIKSSEEFSKFSGFKTNTSQYTNVLEKVKNGSELNPDEVDTLTAVLGRNHPIIQRINPPKPKNPKSASEALKEFTNSKADFEEFDYYAMELLGRELTPLEEDILYKEVTKQLTKDFPEINEGVEPWNIKGSNGEIKKTYEKALINFKEKVKNKEKPMKDSKTVLGKLLKAFAKDAEPEEMVEAIKAVQGEDVEPEGGNDKLAELEAKVAELTAKLETLYSAEKKEEQGEMHALDELEKELTDADPEEEGKEKEEVKDEDAKNDPKLIEAISEKAQNDEDTTEEIKKEIADAKKVIATIEDKDVRLAVADSFAKVIRGKMTSSTNYKKLMDASKQKQDSASSTIDYSAKFKEIKEKHFRK